MSLLWATLPRQAGQSFWLIGLLAMGLTLLIRGAGVFQGAELALLDHRIQFRQSEGAKHVAVVVETEDDLRRYGYPMPDGQLAKAITRLLDAGARLVAVDKFRDAPVPPGSDELRTLLERESRIVWVTRFGVAPGAGVPAPDIMRESDRTGCAELLPDGDGVNRRALLAQEAQGTSCLSLSLAAVAADLIARGERADFDGQSELRLGASTLSRLEGGSGLYSRGELGGFQIALSHPTRSVPSNSLRQLLEGEPLAVRGRLVFIGAAAASLGDMHLVPDSRGAEVRHLPGVMLHARIAEELLRNASGEARPVRSLPLFALFLAIITLATIGAWTGVQGQRITSGLLIIAVAALGWLMLVVVLDGYYWRGESLPPLFALLSALSMGWARRAQLERLERAQMKELFSRQVAPEVAQAIWEQRDAFFKNGRVLPVEVQVTVLFADLRGFTSITEKLAREPMVAWLNGAIEGMTEAVMECGGVVTRFGGDQVMAVFGVPVPRGTTEEWRRDAKQAVRAALRMEERLRVLNERNKADGLPAARVRIGIQSGSALQCGVGSRNRFEFTVLGDAVNTASRLESLATDDDGSVARIFAGQETIALCGEGFVHEPVAELKLKGKDNPVSVFRIRREST